MLNMSTSPEPDSGSAAPSQPDMNNTPLAMRLEGELLSPAAAARLLSLSRQTIYQFIERGMLPVYKLRDVRVSISEIPNDFAV